jgi:16S rRNA (guanine966-N2)-methyltransferase
MSLRITGGHWKGRILKTPAGTSTRPTASILREAVFNILGDRVSDSLFLDLYAGSGIMGFEAASRGANKVILVEKSFKAWNIIRENIQLLNAINFRAEKRAVLNFLPLFKEEGQPADILFADPPFIEAYPDLSEFRTYIKPDGVALFKYPSRETPAWVLQADKIKEYGESSLAIFYA